MSYPWPREHCIDNPHHDATDKKSQSHDPETLEVFPNLLGQCPGRHRRHYKRDQRQTQWMGEDRAIAAFTRRKSADELRDAVTKIDWQRENRAELNHDRVHFPKAVLKIDVQ